MLLNRLTPCNILGEGNEVVSGWRWKGYDFDLLIKPLEEGYEGNLWKRDTENFSVQGPSLEEVAFWLEGLLQKNFPGLFKGRPALERIYGGEEFVVGP